MKNLLLFLVLAFTLTSCSDKQKPNLESDKYSLPFESQKKFMAFKILHFYDGVQHIDAFGDELKSDEWYVQSGMTRVVFPIHGQLADNMRTIGSSELENLSFPLSKDFAKKIKAQILIANGTPMGMYVDAEILLLGERELEVNTFRTSGQEMSLK